jgi:hypothetical protein
MRAMTNPNSIPVINRREGDFPGFLKVCTILDEIPPYQKEQHPSHQCRRKVKGEADSCD